MSTRLRQLRRERLLSQSELARRARVSLRTVHSVEKGAACRLSTQRKLLAALGLDFSQAANVFPETGR